MIPILIIASVIGTLFIFRDDLSDRQKNVLCCVSSAIISVCLHIALMPIYYHYS